MSFKNSTIGKLFVLSLILGSLLIFLRREDTSLAAETDTSNIYLPLVVKNFPKPLSIFGVEINRNTVERTVDFAVEANMGWVRYNGILWNDIEPVPVNSPEGYDWSALETFETEILTLKEQGIIPMVIIRSTPEWARFEEYPDHICGPIRPDALDDFAEFVADMVKKYSQAPYEIRYWEIGNEPDVAPELIPSTHPFGCWGDQDDPYYGGGWYADMLKVVYPAIKQVDPVAKVILGGLLLACDHEEPGYEEQCYPSKYLEGILLNGGGDFLDIVAYHSYPYWYDYITVKDWDLTHSYWDHRGGALIGKLSFIQDVLNRFGINKPVIMNEGGLMCGYTGSDEYKCETDVYEQAKSNYVVRMYARTGAIGIMGSAWYTLNGPGWRYGGLLSGTTRLPAYDVYSFLTHKLGDAEYLGQLSSGDLEGYYYRNPGTNKTYQIYWSNSSGVYSIPKPANTVQVYDRYGVPVIVDLVIPVGFDPVIIEIDS